MSNGCRQIEPGVDFYMSYAAVDEMWAEWIAWQLEASDYRVLLRKWDFGIGTHFVDELNRAVQGAVRTIAVLSQSYLGSTVSGAEWQSAWTGDLDGQSRRLLAFRIENFSPPGLLGQLLTVDLFGIDEESARGRLLKAVRRERAKPDSGPLFPVPSGIRKPAGRREPEFPGRLPDVWNIPARLATFSGRVGLLEGIYRGLNADKGIAPSVSRAATALHGLGGVGKTQLAIEYAWLHTGEYQLAWWIDAEQVPRVVEQLAVLATRAALPVTGRVAEDAAAALNMLRRHPGWLLIYDNAESPTELRPWLADGPGHVLITSRYPAWGGLAARLEVDILPHAEAVAFLDGRIPALAPPVADDLAVELGYLPLALEQAAAYLETTNMPSADYLFRFRTRRAKMLSRGQDLSYRGAIDTVWSLALDRLRERTPAASTLLDLCAQLGPEPIPLALVYEHSDLLDSPLQEIVAGTDQYVDLDDILAAILSYSLVRRNASDIQVHRLVAAVIRASQPHELSQKVVATVRALLVAYLPEDPHDPASWPAWGNLISHVLTAPALHPDDPTADIGHNARLLLLAAVHYLEARGDFYAARAFGQKLHTRWTTTFGPDHPDTLAAARRLAAVHRALGDYRGSRALEEAAYLRQRALFGEDHPNTLRAISNLAIDLTNLGDHQAARELHEATLIRMRGVLGEDHPDTLRAANRLAADLTNLGEHQAALELDESILSRRRRTLGDNHLDTLRSANNLGVDLTNIGQYYAARALHEDTLNRRKDVFGEDHPDTLHSGHKLAAALAITGAPDEARRLFEEILARRCRVLGEEHPDTLRTAHNFAVHLSNIGIQEEARRLFEEILARRCRVLGEEHPDTLRTKRNHAMTAREVFLASEVSGRKLEMEP